jgi:hypothetical protein
MQRYPLLWPSGYPRTETQVSSSFKNLTLGREVDKLLIEIDRIRKGTRRAYPKGDGVSISSNVPLRNDGLPRADYQRSVIVDKGVAVYFERNGSDVVLCCDKYKTVEENLHAITLSIEAMRSIERWGVSDFIERSFTGFKALPAATKDLARYWYEVFGFQEPPQNTEQKYLLCEAYYKRRVKEVHPDVPGGSTEKFQELASAWSAAQNYFLRKPGAAPAY